MFESIYATYESLFYSVGSFLGWTSIFLKSSFMANWLTIVTHANSFAPLMDAICPRAFLIECVDSL